VDYAHDLQYEEVQKELLEYLLPACLAAWRADLLGEYREYGGFVEHFYPALARVTGSVLEPAAVWVVSAFMRAAILSEMDRQEGLSYAGMRARPYRWVAAFTTYGVLFQGLDELWADGFSGITAGRAIAAVQYLSCLIYEDRDNAVFAPWTLDAGGGPPVLWNYAGHLYEHRWLPENVAFLRQTLSPSWVVATLRRAVARLADLEEEAVAKRVLDDA
jgi:hypothetical protein